VVGPAGESDLELLSTVAALFANLKLRRAYFEAFNPIVDTPFESRNAESPLRQQRLYQASYLLRDYGFELEELPFLNNGQLPEDRDPKRAYADLHYQADPLEINHVPKEMLLRIPGIGPRAAESILHARVEKELKELGQLQRLGILAEQAAPYIQLAGKRPIQQPPLFTT
jgi:predicted DNA-binding helix-hairpin-helix protein